MLRLASTSVLAAAGLVAVMQAPVVAADSSGGATASAAPDVTCSAGVGDGRKTVLLVHGTGSTADETWGWSWRRTLPAQGYGVCTVDVPGRELGSITTSAKYVADAVAVAHQKAGRKIAMVGHSQGGTLVVWAAKFFPDVAARTDDVISLAGDFGGTALVNVPCLDGACPDAAWQLGIGSRHLKALRDAPMPAGTSFTSIYSLSDEVVFPQPTGSTLPGASNVSVQSVCGLRLVGHAGMVADAAGYAVAKDALQNPGPGQVSRITFLTKAAACANVFQPETRPLAAGGLVATVGSFAGGVFLGGQPDAREEPALPPYAEPYA